MQFIKVTEVDGALFVPIDQILFLKSKESETEIFLKNRAGSLTVKEPLSEVIKNMRIAQTPGAGLPSERVIAVVQGNRNARSSSSEIWDRSLSQARTAGRRKLS